MTIAEKLTAVAENQQKVYDAGYAAGQSDSSADNIQYASSIRFIGTAFPEGYEMTLYAPLLTELPQLRNATGIRKITLDVPTDRTYSATNLCYPCESVEELVLPAGIQITAANYMCTNAYSLRSVQGAMDMTGNTSNNMWTGCRNLEEISFVPNTIGAKIDFAKSDKLSDASIQSIIDGLADLTGQETQTLTFHATVGVKLTDEQKTAISAKNWTLAY